MLRWEDTDLSRTSVCLKQLWSTPQVLDLALARRFVLTVCACSRCMARSRCSRACSHGRRLPSASSFQLAVGAPLARTRSRHVASKGVSLHTNCMLSRLGVHVHAVTRCCWGDGCTSLRKVFSIIAVGEILFWCLCSLHVLVGSRSAPLPTY